MVVFALGTWGDERWGKGKSFPHTSFVLDIFYLLLEIHVLPFLYPRKLTYMVNIKGFLPSR